MTRQDIERALDSGLVEVRVGVNRWWKARRNGKTHCPKRAPDAWHIPVKYGFRGYARLDQADFDHGHARIVEQENG